MQRVCCFDLPRYVYCSMTVLAVIALFVVLFMVFISTVLLVIGPVMLLQPHRRTIEFYRTDHGHPASVGHRAGP